MGGDFKRHRVIIESDQSKRRPAWNEWKEGNGVRVPKKLKVKHTKPTSGLCCCLAQKWTLRRNSLDTVARERFFNRVVKTNLFQLGVWGRCKPPAGSEAEPRMQADFDNNLLKSN